MKQRLMKHVLYAGCFFLTVVAWHVVRQGWH